MIFVILIASINRKRMILMWLWSIGREILKPSTSKWVFLEKWHQGGLGSSLLVYSSPAYKSWGSQINSFYLSTIYLIFDLMWCTQLGRMNSDVALIMLDIPVVQCGSVNAEGNFLSPQPCFSNRGRDLINTCPMPIPHICHKFHMWDMWRKICHVEKFQISIHGKWGEIWKM